MAKQYLSDKKGNLKCKCGSIKFELRDLSDKNAHCIKCGKPTSEGCIV